MDSLACKLLFPVFIGMTASGVAAAQARDCDKDLAACIGRAAAETAAFVDVCGRIHPESKSELDDALAKWSVRKLQIPGLEEALKPDSPHRIVLRRKATAYMKSVGSYEREIECSGRMAMLKNKQPKLRADFVSLPQDPLEQYLK